MKKTYTMYHNQQVFDIFLRTELHSDYLTCDN